MLIDRQFVSRVLQDRPLVSHKGTFGRMLLIGGSYPYGGAIIMAALACVNGGAGLVMVATDRDNISALHAHLPEAMAFDLTDREQLLAQLALADLVLLGPGLGEEEQGQLAFDLVLAHIASHQTLILDGSALGLLAGLNEVTWRTNQLVLTPHQKEWERLSGLLSSQQTSLANQAALASYPDQTILVAKSHQTRVYDQTGQVGRVMAGGPHQAIGGMGDTLAGMIAAFIVQFKEASLFDRVAAATYLHSAIADDLAETAYVVLPTKISQALPRVMATFQKT